MKAAIVHSPNEVPVYGDFPEPQVSEGRELVTLVAAGIHPLVRLVATGKHYSRKGAWPMIPGVDAVARMADGALVYTGFMEPPYGTFAERMASPAAMRFSVPAGADPVQVAAGMNPGMSSWLPLQARMREVPKLGTVLILGVTGMAGLLAVQNAFALGAERVIGAGRNAAGLKQAEDKKAETVTLTGDRQADATAIASALGSDAPSLVLDFVWGEPAEATFDALGRAKFAEEDKSDIAHVQIGSMAGAEASVSASLLRSRRVRISGSGLGSASMADIMAQVPVYMKLIGDRRVEVPTREFPLSKIADAWAANDSGTRTVVVAG
jgi:NADPH:quinone reductase-like Zn-dependent oxidoreductase